MTLLQFGIPGGMELAVILLIVLPAAVGYHIYRTVKPNPSDKTFTFKSGDWWSYGVACAKRGYLGVWRLIYWNILAFVARLAFAAWLLVALAGWAIGDAINEEVGILLGAVTFFGVPILWGAFQLRKAVSEEDTDQADIV